MLVRILTKVPDKYKAYPRVSGKLTRDGASRPAIVSFSGQTSAAVILRKGRSPLLCPMKLGSPLDVQTDGVIIRA